MKDLKLDSQHDLLIRNGQLVLVDGVNQTAQQIKIALLTFLGEWFMDTSVGLPWFEQNLIKQPEKAKVENIFRKKVLEVKDVLRVIEMSLEVERQSRALIVSFKAETSNGLISDKVPIEGKQ